MDTVAPEILANTPPELAALVSTSGLYDYHGFTVRSGFRSNRTGSAVLNYFEAVHDDPHIYAYGCDGKLKKAKFSISEVLHGSNGVLIKNQQEIDAALTRAKDILSPLCSPQVTFGRFMRIDVAHHIECEPAKMLAFLKTLTIPKIRKSLFRHQDNAVQFLGSNYTVSVYSKTHQRQNRSGIPHNRPLDPAETHLRLELQAKNWGAVKETFDTQYGTLVYDELWRGYRRFFASIPPAALYDGPFSPRALVKLCTEEGLTLPGGKPVLDWWAESCKPNSVRKGKREMAAITFSTQKINLIDLIPEIPTRFIDVDADGLVHVVLVDPSPIP